jgi:hypothetical protein
MARNSIWVGAPVEVVWSVLADPFAYPEWVVGAQRARAADPGWPAPGSRLHHRVGIGPLSVRDRTTVIEADPPRRSVLDAAARPLGRARVEICLHAEGDGTRVVMVEDPSGFTAPLRLNPAIQALIKLRNVEALRRFRDIAERRRRAAERSAQRARQTPRGPRAAAG